MSTDTTTTKRRTITLTDRAPVTIEEITWPIIARADGDSWAGSDYGRHQQASHQGEIDAYTLIVRRHADGRVLVYGVLTAAIRAWGAPAHGESWRGGELLGTARPANNDVAGREEQVSLASVAAAIRRVGEAGNLPDRIIRDCVADLPAEEL